MAENDADGCCVLTQLGGMDLQLNNILKTASNNLLGQPATTASDLEGGGAA